MTEADLKVLINRLQNLLDTSKSALTDSTKILPFEVRFAKVEKNYAEFEQIQEKIITRQVKLNLDVSTTSANDIYFEIQQMQKKIEK